MRRWSGTRRGVYLAAWLAVLAGCNDSSGSKGLPECVYTYTPWGECGTNGLQARAVVTTTPDRCAGTPEVTQVCTPTCTYGYSEWSACGADGQQTRTVVSTTPDGCSGTPFLGQSCTPTTEFFSSFEAGQPAPSWVSTAEKIQGVTGKSYPGIDGLPGNLALIGRIQAVASTSENPPNEGKESLVDGDAATKMLARKSTVDVTYTLGEPTAVTAYLLTSANDAADRDPKDWRLLGSNDDALATWDVLDTQTGQVFSGRFQARTYTLAGTSAAYRYYRLSVSKNNGSADMVQLAEWQLSAGGTNPVEPGDMRAVVLGGPSSAYNSKTGVGFTGLRSLQYGGYQTEAGGYAYAKVFDVDVAVTPDTRLSYVLFPELTGGDLRYPSTYASVDLLFDDGTFLSELGARDQHGVKLDPVSQGDAATLYANQWNYRLADVGAVAGGKRIRRILVAYRNPGGPILFQGWVDDIRITGAPAQPAPTHLSDWVVTTRGTFSNGSFSRGNNFPATALPHGFNFWTPVTDAGSSWMYAYQAQNNGENLPTIQAFTASHEPSPWMGDRQTFQFMPAVSPVVPSAKRTSRALAFRHEDEIARAHYYSVTFQNGIRTEITPTDHAAMVRFTYPSAGGSVIFDNMNGSAAINSLSPATGEVTAYSDVKGNYPQGVARMFMYARFDRGALQGGKITGNSSDAAYLRFDTGATRTVTMRVATSLISVDQARKNLELEIGAADTFETVMARAQDAWDRKLGVIEVEGGTDDQLTSLYSSLYRLNLYPNSAYENVGTAEAPVYRHVNQSSASGSIPAGTTATAVPETAIVDGKAYVNNGFWDTYRTTWTAYSLLYPADAGEMVEGFVQQYRDGGWISRWSSPGYADIMTGTSSDVAFADAYLRGVTFDARTAYEAGLKNATVVSPDSHMGRKGVATGTFLGFTPAGTSESISWALEGYLNDFGLGNMAAALALDPSLTDGERARYEAEAAYLIYRSRNYALLFDSTLYDPVQGSPAAPGGFFQSRSAAGFTYTAATFNPRAWGNGFTESDGWNYAFHAPHDGQGLADLYGGREGLATKLDAFFATPEQAAYPGGYGGTIHEMTEARDVRMGQWGLSNQVSHHIPYMYAYAGQPWKTQAVVREALRRCFVGSEIGQGYPGDEDNGELSGWYVFGALGFYPLQMGSPTFVLGSPLFPKATIHLENGKDVVITAQNNSTGNVFVQALALNGQAYGKTYLTHADLTAGANLDFVMGATPSTWGSAEDAVPPSITGVDEAPVPLVDVANAGGTPSSSSGTASAAFDNSSATAALSLAGQAGTVQLALAAPATVGLYTVTSAAGSDTLDPRDWVVEGSNDGVAWDLLDTRTGERFAWRQQTRVFLLAQPVGYAYYRLSVTANAGGATTSIAELEFLNAPWVK